MSTHSTTQPGTPCQNLAISHLQRNMSVPKPMPCVESAASMMLSLCLEGVSNSVVRPRVKKNLQDRVTRLKLEGSTVRVQWVKEIISAHTWRCWGGGVPKVETWWPGAGSQSISTASWDIRPCRWETQGLKWAPGSCHGDQPECLVWSLGLRFCCEHLPGSNTVDCITKLEGALLTYLRTVCGCGTGPCTSVHPPNGLTDFCLEWAMLLTQSVVTEGENRWVYIAFFFREIHFTLRPFWGRRFIYVISISPRALHFCFENLVY